MVAERRHLKKWRRRIGRRRIQPMCDIKWKKNCKELKNERRIGQGRAERMVLKISDIGTGGLGNRELRPRKQYKIHTL